MSTHRSNNTPQRTPNWLKAWYAFLAFMLIMVVVSVTLA